MDLGKATSTLAMNFDKITDKASMLSNFSRIKKVWATKFQDILSYFGFRPREYPTLYFCRPKAMQNMQECLCMFVNLLFPPGVTCRGRCIWIQVNLMDRYRWIILGLCEMRWKNFGETTTEEGHKVFFSGKGDKHEHGVGFIAHKDIGNAVMGRRPVSSRLITTRPRAVPFNITTVQAHAPTSDYDDNEIEEFCDQLQNVPDQTPKKDILVVQGDWNASGQGCLWKLARHLWTLQQ